MNNAPRQRLAYLSVLAVSLMAATAAVWAADGTEVVLVAKTDTLPNAAVSAGDVARVKPLLATLPEGHQLRLEFMTISKAVTGYPEDRRYLCLVTTVDAAGKPDGKEVNYVAFSGQAVRRATYKHGVQDGLEQKFDVQSGAVVGEIPWVNGKVHGVKRTLHPNGKPANETTFEQGVIRASRSYTEDGQVGRIVLFADGERHGATTEYWPDKPDAVKQVIPYRKGKVDGVVKAFYLNGGLKWERPFRDNRQHGIEKQYAVDGKVEKSVYWLNGNPVSAEAYQNDAGK